MATIFTSSDVTSGYAKAIHAGVNAKVDNFDLTETATVGTITINMLKLPAGGQVVNLKYFNDVGIGGTGNERVSVQDNLGNVYITTSSDLTYLESNGVNLMTRLTGSAHLQVKFHDCVGTGTVSNSIQLICEYLAEQDGD